MKIKKEWLYEHLKNTEEKKVFKEFELPIFDFLGDLEQSGFLRYEYDLEEAKKFMSFLNSLNTLSKFYNSLINDQKV
jgi:hypothetical protein